MALKDNKRDILLGQSVEEQVKKIDDNFTELYDNEDDLQTQINGIKNAGYITKDVDNLTNYTVKTETGTDIELLLDTSNYKMTLNLKNANGKPVSTAMVDFPIESMVVDASYKDGTLTLTLQNGTTLDVDISAIISGLVPDTRTINGKNLKTNVTLTQDDVGEGTTYKCYTATEKTKLAGIAEGANKYVHPNGTAKSKGFYKFGVNAQGHVIDAVSVQKGDITALGIPDKSPATESADGLMSSGDKKKLNAIDGSLQGVTADEIGKVKDVKVNGGSVLGTDGVASITIEDLKSGYSTIQASTSKVINGTTYYGFTVDTTNTDIGVYDYSTGQQLVVERVKTDNGIFIACGTTKDKMYTIRTLNGGAVGSSSGSGGGSAEETPVVSISGKENATKVSLSYDSYDKLKNPKTVIKFTPEGSTNVIYLTHRLDTTASDRKTLQYFAPYHHILGDIACLVLNAYELIQTSTGTTIGYYYDVYALGVTPKD